MPKQRNILYSPPDELHPPVGGAFIEEWSDLFAPGPGDLRRMLSELRAKLGWSLGFTAGVLGVGVSTLTKWESATRNPNGGVAKLIFLLHSLLVDKSGKVRNPWDLAVWGKLPCRKSLVQAIHMEIALNPTHVLPEDDLVVFWAIRETKPKSQAWFPII
jgi:transcriptional regulator with XRE-family HTH domain